MPSEPLESKVASVRDPMRWPPLTYLGFAAYWAWLFIAIADPFILDPARTSSEAHLFVFVFLGVAAVVKVTAALAAPRVEPAITARSLLVSAAVLSAAGSVAASSVRFVTSSPNVLLVLGSVLCGIGAAGLVLAWGSLYAGLDQLRSTSGIATSVGLGALVHILASVGLRPLAAISTAALLPLISLAALLLSHPVATPGTVKPADPPTRLRVPWRFALTIAIFSLGYGLMYGISQPAVLSWRLAIGLCGIGACLLLLRSILSSPFDSAVSVVYRILLPLLAAAFLLLPFLAEPFALANAIALTAFICFGILLWGALSVAASRLALSPVRVFGLGWSGGWGLLGGALVGRLVVTLAGSDYRVLYSISLGTVFLLLVAMLVLLRGTDVFGELGSAIEPVRGTPMENSESGTRVLAEHYGLSAREREVLALLLKGRSLPYIAEEYDITLNTAKSHVRNVYNKIGVHTRQELLDLAQSELESGRRRQH